MDNQKNQIWETFYEIKEYMKAVSSSLDGIKNAINKSKLFDNGRIVEIDSLKTQKQEMIKQTKEMRSHTKYLLFTFIVAILALLFNIIYMLVVK